MSPQCLRDITLLKNVFTLMRVMFFVVDIEGKYQLSPERDRVHACCQHTAVSADCLSIQFPHPLAI